MCSVDPEAAGNRQHVMTWPQLLSKTLRESAHFQGLKAELQKFDSVSSTALVESHFFFHIFSQPQSFLSVYLWSSRLVDMWSWFRSSSGSFSFTCPLFSTPPSEPLVYFSPDVVSILPDCHTGRWQLCTLNGFSCLLGQPLVQGAPSCRTTLSKSLWWFCTTFMSEKQHFSGTVGGGMR